MHIAVLGAGAVGCYYGGLLARAGHPVTLIGRPSHVSAMQQHGLRLHTATFDEPIAVHASTEVAAAAPADLVLCCVKSTDTRSAAIALRPHLKPGARVLSLQNGIDNVDTLQDVLQRPVWPVVVYVAAAMAGPGHVRHHGRGELVLAAGALDPAQREAFVQAGIPLQLSDNVPGALWFKLILNCGFNALSALTQKPYGELWPFPGVADAVNTVVAECLAVAAAEGVELPDDPRPAIAAIADSMPQQRSSTAQDLARGKPTEIDFLNGAIVRRGQRLGIATPTNQLLHTLVKLAEAAPPPAA